MESYSLDLFSTSPTTEDMCSEFLPQKTVYVCDYNAPYFCYKSTDFGWSIVQGCCNHWDCGRCGIQLAKQHYGRIIEGCRTLVKHNMIYFITITCKGKELSKARAENGYAEWTESFLDACYTKAKRSGLQWDYVHVTERQDRGHPHGHILTTFCPLDLRDGYVEKWKTDNTGRLRKILTPALRSPWLEKQVKRSGLGEQYDISFVEKPEGASRYVAKYLFKKTIFTDKWPKGWKRIRYSQSFPKLPKRESNARVLLSQEDWNNLAREAAIVRTTNIVDYSTAEFYLRGHDVIVTMREEKRQTVN